VIEQRDETLCHRSTIGAMNNLAISYRQPFWTWKKQTNLKRIFHGWQVFLLRHLVAKRGFGFILSGVPDVSIPVGSCNDLGCRNGSLQR